MAATDLINKFKWGKENVMINAQQTNYFKPCKMFGTNKPFATYWIFIFDERTLRNVKLQIPNMEFPLILI